MNIVKVKYLSPNFMDVLPSKCTDVDVMNCMRRETCEQCTVGYIVLESEDWLVLTSSYKNQGANRLLDGVIAISKRDILEREVMVSNKDELATEEFEKEVEKFLNEQLSDL